MLRLVGPDQIHPEPLQFFNTKFPGKKKAHTHTHPRARTHTKVFWRAGKVRVKSAEMVVTFALLETPKCGSGRMWDLGAWDLGVRGGSA